MDYYDYKQARHEELTALAFRWFGLFIKYLAVYGVLGAIGAL